MPDFNDPFLAIGKKWADDAYNTRLSDVPEVVYHYTDAAGLVGMLCSGKVWATDYRFLNDKSEVEHTRREVRDLVNKKLHENPDELLSRFYERILLSQEKMSITDAFVFSFSQERDDLSQWRGYAREGHGFTIGFCGRTLCNRSSPDDATYAFFKVEYDYSRQVGALQRALSDIADHLKMLASQENAVKDDLADRAAKAFFWLSESRAEANKHVSFRSEHEWRISAHRAPTKDIPILVRSSGLRLVRYIDLDLGEKDDHLPIKEIGIGPGFTGNEEVLAVKSLCERFGYDVNIYFADTPYRRIG